MNDEFLQQLSQAAEAVVNGDVIAYPTETVFGLGCDPRSQTAVKKLLQIKDRNWQKGLIIIAASSDQLADFFSSEWLQWLDKKQPQQATSYVIPCLDAVPEGLKGNHKTLAVRLTTDEISHRLCQLTGALVSTSANKKDSPPLLNSEAIQAVFQNQLGYILSGEIISGGKSSQIIDAVSGNILRV